MSYWGVNHGEEIAKNQLRRDDQGRFIKLQPSVRLIPLEEYEEEEDEVSKAGPPSMAAWERTAARGYANGRKLRMEAAESASRSRVLGAKAPIKKPKPMRPIDHFGYTSPNKRRPSAEWADS